MPGQSLKLGFSHGYWMMGAKVPFLWHPDSVPHLLISGITGGGKSVCAQYIVNQLLDTDARPGETGMGLSRTMGNIWNVTRY